MSAEHEENAEEAGWEFVRHVEGSAYHQLQEAESWIQYWMRHVNVNRHPCLCPGDKFPSETENKEAHELLENSENNVQTVGCHVILKHKDTNKRAYAIIPACNSCNKADRSKFAFGNLTWYCKAVTILQEDAYDHNFVGKITVRTSDEKGKTKALWWHCITDIIVEDCADEKTLKIRGYTNMDAKPDPPQDCDTCTFVEDKKYRPSLVCAGCKRRQYTYMNYEDYLLKIACFWRDATAVRDLGRRGALVSFERRFKPRVLRCNEKMYPNKNRQIRRDYKIAYGLCKKEHCHNDSQGDDLCKECFSLHAAFSKWRELVPPDVGALSLIESAAST